MPSIRDYSLGESSGYPGRYTITRGDESSGRVHTVAIIENRAQWQTFQAAITNGLPETDAVKAIDQS